MSFSSLFVKSGRATAVVFCLFAAFGAICSAGDSKAKIQEIRNKIERKLNDIEKRVVESNLDKARIKECREKLGWISSLRPDKQMREYVFLQGRVDDYFPDSPPPSVGHGIDGTSGPGSTISLETSPSQGTDSIETGNETTAQSNTQSKQRTKGREKDDLDSEVESPVPQDSAPREERGAGYSTMVLLSLVSIAVSGVVGYFAGSRGAKRRLQKIGLL